MFSSMFFSLFYFTGFEYQQLLKGGGNPKACAASYEGQGGQR